MPDAHRGYYAEKEAKKKKKKKEEEERRRWEDKMHRSSKASGSKSAANSENDRNMAQLREFQAGVAENKLCFDCGQKGPTYINMTVGSFVCTKCSGML